MKKYTLLLVLLALSTSAWGYTVGTCNSNPGWNSNPCWNPSPCWNSCPSSCSSQISSYSCMSSSQCVQQTCGPILGVHGYTSACGLQATSCLGAFSNFQMCGGTQFLGCGLFGGSSFGCGSNFPHN